MKERYCTSISKAIISTSTNFDYQEVVLHVSPSTIIKYMYLHALTCTYMYIVSTVIHVSTQLRSQ